MFEFNIPEPPLKRPVLIERKRRANKQSWTDCEEQTLAKLAIQNDGFRLEQATRALPKRTRLQVRNHYLKKMYKIGDYKPPHSTSPVVKALLAKIQNLPASELCGFLHFSPHLTYLGYRYLMRQAEAHYRRPKEAEPIEAEPSPKNPPAQTLSDMSFLEPEDQPEIYQYYDCYQCASAKPCGSATFAPQLLNKREAYTTPSCSEKQCYEPSLPGSAMSPKGKSRKRDASKKHGKTRERRKKHHSSRKQRPRTRVVRRRRSKAGSVFGSSGSQTMDDYAALFMNYCGPINVYERVAPLYQPEIAETKAAHADDFIQDAIDLYPDIEPNPESRETAGVENYCYYPYKYPHPQGESKPADLLRIHESPVLETDESREEMLRFACRFIAARLMNPEETEEYLLLFMEWMYEVPLSVTIARLLRCRNHLSQL